MAKSAPAPTFDPSSPDGGNPKFVNVNAQYAGNEFHYVYLVVCGFLVWLIIPGVGLLYGGLARRKSALSMLFQSLMVVAITTFQWMFWGFSLAYSRTAGPFIGDLRNFGMINVASAPSVGSPSQPDIVFCFYQLMFAACATMIVVGGSFERGRIVPSLVFSFWWTTLVYSPIACWTWNPNGWLFTLPSLDFAGGGPVHIASGSAALAYAVVLGKRKHRQPGVKKAHNVTIIFLGTVLIWFGWFGFNGGSALNATIRSMNAVFNTNTAASTGVIGYVLVDYFKHGRKFSVVAACEGAIAGLVGITPAAGYVSVWSAALIGFLTAVFISLIQNINDWMGIDEGMDVFKLHGMGGICGSFLTGIFATSSISSLDGLGTMTPGGIDGNAIQVGKQFAEICAISTYSFTVSLILCVLLKYTPGMHLRVTDEAEMIGLDLDQFCDEQIGDWSLFERMDGLMVAVDGQTGDTKSISPSSDHQKEKSGGDSQVNHITDLEG